MYAMDVCFVFSSMAAKIRELEFGDAMYKKGFSLFVGVCKSLHQMYMSLVVRKRLRGFRPGPTQARLYSHRR